MLRAVARGAPGTLWRRIYEIASPAAGADVTVPVPAHRAWQLLGVSARLVASGVAGNRIPVLTLQGSDGISVGKIASPTAVTAGLTNDVSWLPGTGAAVVVAASFSALTLPADWYMVPAESLTITGHTDPVDQWSNVRVTVLETNTGDPAYIGAIERRIEDHIEGLYELTH